jgi:N-acetylmuramoyl-L-alanine amidase
LRAISEALGASVKWDGKSKTITLTLNSDVIKLTIGKAGALKNGQALALDSPARIIAGNTMVPLRFISEAFGAYVQWNRGSRTIAINYLQPDKQQRELVVQADQLNVRSGPGTDHETLTQVSRGTRLPILDTSADWYEVKLPSGKTGWVVAWYVKEDSQSSASGSDTTETTGQNSSSGNDQKDEQISDKGSLSPPDQVAPPYNPSSQSATVQKISIDPGDKKVNVEVTCDRRVTYNIFTLNSPDRLIIDLNDTQPGSVNTSQEINSAIAGRLRIGWSHSPDITRLVFDLTGKAAYKVQAGADPKTISLVIFVPDIHEALKGAVIVLDPGHGGSEPGAIGGNLGLAEKNVNMQVAECAGELLRSYGADVLYTRYGDQDLGLYERAGAANNAGADVFVSIHMNANLSSGMGGTSTYFSSNALNGQDRQVKSSQLADYIQNSLVANLGLENKNVRQADFVVIRETVMPAVLIEAAFISNPNEEYLMTTEQFRNSIARALVNGIGMFLAGQTE